METRNYSHYQNREFANWAFRDQLAPAEQFLTEKFLSKDKSTLEAGTGGGCILHCLRDHGFEQLHGFDFLRAFIEVAKERDSSGEINFIVADASALPYADNTFAQALYLQQVLCMIEDADKREAAIRELARVMSPGSTALFSFLCYEARERQKSYRMFLAYLRVLRLFFGRGRTLQLQPWLRHGNNFNPLALLDKPPYVYWYHVQEAVAMLERYGFEIIAAASEREVLQQRTVGHHELQNDVTGILYLVARKQSCP